MPRPTFLLVPALLLPVLWGGLDAAGAVVRGRVIFPREDLAQPRRPTIAELGTPPARPVLLPRQGVVYLESAAPRPPLASPPPVRVTIDQRQETFVPRVVAIQTGTTVEFPNNDRTYHNVFSLSKPKPFDLGRYAAGRSKSVRFDRPGIVRVFCEIHSHMSAFVLVFDHPFFAVTDDEGRFRIDGVPPGDHTLTVWSESLPEVSVRVPVGTADADVELVIPAPGGR